MRIRWLLLLVAVALLSFNYGLADRLDEMVDEIEDRIEEGEERDVLIDGVEAYIDERDDALSELANLISATSESEMSSRWASVVDDMLDLPELDDLDDDLSSSEALALYNQFVDEERAWWLALSRINPAAHRDSIVQQRLRLVNMTELLEDKWAELLSDDSSIDEKQLSAIKALTETYLRTVRESRDNRERTRGWLGAAADVAANDMVGTMFIPGVLGDIIGMLAQTVKVYNDYKSTQESMEAQLKEMATQELKLLEEFLATREDTQLFTKENNFDLMKALYAEAENELRSVTSVGTSEQRRDAENFANLIRSSLTRHVSEGESIFNAFVSKHQGKFYGPISPEAREALQEPQVWLAEGRDAQTRGRDLQEDLRAWRDDANNLFGVNFSRDGITDEERQFIRDYLRGDLEALMRAMEDDDFIEELTLLFDRRNVEETLD
jgi:hypothetical protein